MVVAEECVLDDDVCVVIEGDGYRDRGTYVVVGGGGID